MNTKEILIDISKVREMPLDENGIGWYNLGGGLACQIKEVRRMAEPKTVSASLQIDRGVYVIRGRVYDPLTRKTKQRSKSTGLLVKDNTKRKAEKEMKRIIEIWTREANAEVIREDPLFSEYVHHWIEKKRMTLKATSVKSYEDYVHCHILPKLGHLRVREMNLQHLQRFYQVLLEDLSVSSVRKLHVVVSGALLDAVRDGVIPVNFAQYVEFPRGKKFQGSTYSPEQVAVLLTSAENAGEPLHAAAMLAVCYGLRRSEIVGLRWNDIDFDANTLTVQNTVVQNGLVKIEAEQTKTAKSHRVISLIGSTIPYLKSLKSQQIKSGLRLDKVCVWPDGREVRPDFLTHKVPALMKKAGLPPIRLHDLRHTAATILATVASPKQVQEFLGHEDISTTMNVYTHLLDKERIETSKLLDSILKTSVFCSGNCSGANSPT